ncbi:hypothetical protein GUJ93_ZPchr0008g12965 [Zizania palustris]|uniref:Uncharacterized protein n=1 Tax=Zizania palustris TaxID=103762 RepID=A0A8J5V1Y8_ZIZPA|nr:hypothetical protein GUJ93_ZPchr0008g12965 [Zizania palustris]
MQVLSDLQKQAIYEQYDDDPSNDTTLHWSSTFLNVVVLGNVVSINGFRCSCFSLILLRFAIVGHRQVDHAEQPYRAPRATDREERGDECTDFGGPAEGEQGSATCPSCCRSTTSRNRCSQVGHSIGAYICLKIFKRLQKKDRRGGKALGITKSGEIPASESGDSTGNNTPKGQPKEEACKWRNQGA